MKRLMLARILLGAIGVAVWGYGYRIDDSNVRYAGIAILAVALVLRFVPPRWFRENDRET
jgi:membrane protein YdbS with pleckstrin-like domain